MNSKPFYAMILFCFGFALSTASVQAQDYLLEYQNMTATAKIAGDQLTIRHNAKEHRYTHDDQLDSLDGVYKGFYCFALNKSIRFPVTGNRRIYITDAHGLWTMSKMRVTLIKPHVRPIARKPTVRQICGTGSSRPSLNQELLDGQWHTQEDESKVKITFRKGKYDFMVFDEFEDVINESHGKYKFADLKDRRFTLKTKSKTGTLTTYQGVFSADRTKMKLTPSDGAALILRRN